MEELLFIYQDVILEFLLELYVFYLLTTRKLDRAPWFWVKVLGGLGVILTLAFGAAAAYRLCGQTVAGRIGIYLFLFAATMLHARLCFAEGFSTVLFCCSVAYGAQNLCYKLYLLAWCGGMALNLYDRWGTRFDLYYRLMQYTFFITAAVLAYLFFIRPLTRHISSWQMDKQLLAITVVILVITVILCSVEDIYFAKLSVGVENRFALPEHFVLRQTGNLFSVLCCGIVLLLASRTVEQRELRQEVEYLQHAIRQSERQYEISRDTIELINVKCHDIRYKLGSLAAQGGGLGVEAMADLEKSISIYDARIETGNQLLDVLLTEKSLYCELTASISQVPQRLCREEETLFIVPLFLQEAPCASEAPSILPRRSHLVGATLVVARFHAGTLTFPAPPSTSSTDWPGPGFYARSRFFWDSEEVR
ncbi:hypothetical protein H7U37_08330 [Pseudoflavonifractor phocaeensis]|uniref:hypothetical protein n=1 Tax=Pseudoflavonifractor phocaeensis TaxID=1870988 RepID=UPI0019568BA1|nr:hypothetical protein [Pseudoflavonifractor phocaeensis]MBM6938527.1 hypothetical protein [Pseudoflavonifractor phocaeensis]